MLSIVQENLADSVVKYLSRTCAWDRPMGFHGLGAGLHCMPMGYKNKSMNTLQK